jgi:hypothetical protein
MMLHFFKDGKSESDLIESPNTAINKSTYSTILILSVWVVTFAFLHALDD